MRYKAKSVYMYTMKVGFSFIFEAYLSIRCGENHSLACTLASIFSCIAVNILMVGYESVVMISFDFVLFSSSWLIRSRNPFFSTSFNDGKMGQSSRLNKET